MSISQSKTITFKISDIKVTNFSIKNDLVYYQLPNTHQYTFEIKLKVLINPDLKSIGIETQALIYKDIGKSELLCNLVVFIIYKIENFDDVVTKRENDYTLAPLILKSFMANNIGVTRGILYTKTQGTFLQNVFLPPIDVNKFIK